MSTPSFTVRREGQMSVPLYRRETQRLSSYDEKKRAGSPVLAPTNVTGYLRMRASQLLDLYVSGTENQQPIQDYLPIQMLG